MKFVRSFGIGLLLVLLIPLLAACGSSDSTTAPTSGVSSPPSSDTTSAPAGDVPTSATSGNGAGATIRVGTKDFTEQFILGEMYRLALENAGFTVELKKNLGATSIAQEALVNDEIDLYPEYTGTGLLTVLGQSDFANKSDAKAVYDATAKGYKEQFNLVWLAPAPMNNTQALAMTKEGSEKFGITTISEMAAKSGELRMIGPPEFQEREDGLPGIQQAYGNFKLKQYIAVDPGLKYKGLTEGQADVSVAFGTDGEIAAFDLVVLKDDKGLFPIYQVAPVVRQQALDANPQIADVLNAVDAKLTDEVMQRLNYEVSGKQRADAEVAEEFLRQEGLIK